jgi:regulator of sirC expression with transglutaminase-like and TPR domain
VSSESRARFAEVMGAVTPDLGLACLLLAQEVLPDYDVAAGLAELDLLAEQAIADVAASAPAFDIASGLRSALGDRAGFRGYGSDYGDVRSSLLPEVLERRRGLPILLTVVYIEVGRRLGVAVQGIGLPGHFVASVPGGDGARVLLDPFYGGRLITPAELSARVGEILGEETEVTESQLQPWSVRDIVTRVLGNIRAASTTTGTLRTRLWAVELSMLVPGAAPGLRKERGEVLARLGDFLGAARDLESYAELVGSLDPVAADEAMRSARMVRARLS